MLVLPRYLMENMLHLIYSLIRCTGSDRGGSKVDPGNTVQDVGIHRGQKAHTVHTLVHPSRQFRITNFPTAVVLRGERKPENLELTHTSTLEHVNLDTDRNPSSGSNQDPWSCEAPTIPSHPVPACPGMTFSLLR